jgi:hypothetical protein
MGRATQVSVDSVKNEFTPLLVDGEEVLTAYKVIRDMLVFTNKRLILVNKQGMTGSKVEYLTIPYSKITCFAKESAGLLDLDAELKIWITGHPQPIIKEFKKDDNVNEVYRLLSQAVLG